MKMSIYLRYTLLLLGIAVLILFSKTLFILFQTITPDFSVYYTAAKNLIASQEVYIGHASFTLFAYPLVSTLFFIPFTFLPYQFAQNIFLIGNVGALLGISYIIPFLITRKHSFLFSAFVFSLTYLSFPTKFTLGMGQINLIAYIFLLGSLWFFLRENKLMTALLFAIACICKPVLGFVFLFFLFHKEWRVVSYTIFFGFLAIMVTIVIDKHATQDYMYYLQHVLPAISIPDNGKTIYYNQGLMAFIFRIIPDKVFRLVITYIGMITIFISGIITILKKKDTLFQFSLLLSMIPLLDTMSWQHHFIFLILPFSVVAFFIWKSKKYFWLILLCFAYALVSFNFKMPMYITAFPYNIFESNTFLGALLLFIILLFMPRAVGKRLGKQ